MTLLLLLWCLCRFTGPSAGGLRLLPRPMPVADA